MTADTFDTRRPQGLTADEFLYFFLRLRKGEIRRTVQRLRNSFPDEGPTELAHRLISSKARLSLIGGSLLQLPVAFPGIGQALTLLGMVGATSMLTRMHLYLVLEIALVFDQDIDDRDRIPEMAAVVAATGLSAAAPLLTSPLGLQPWLAIPAGSLVAATTTRLIGECAIRYYSQSDSPAETAPTAA